MSRKITGLQRLRLPAILLLLGLALSACGETTAPKPVDTTPTNEWNNMTWDQSTWG